MASRCADEIYFFGSDCVVSCCVVLCCVVLCCVVLCCFLDSNQTGSGAYTTWLMAPTYFPRGGFVSSGTVRYAGSYGYWWSSAVYSATVARRLSLTPGAVNPESNDYRYNGFSLRCTTLCRIIYNSNQTGSGAYTTWLMAPTYFPRGGYAASGTVRTAGSNGYWWSSTVASAAGAWSLFLVPDAIGPEYANNRSLGFSLRL